MPYPTKLKGGWQRPHQVRGEQKHGSNQRKEGRTQVYEQISGDTTEQYGTGAQRSPGSLSVPRRRQDLCLSSGRDAAEYPEERSFPQNAKRLPGGRNRNTQEYYDEGPSGPYPHSTGVFTESGSWTNASDGQPSDDERTGGKERPDKDLNDGVQGHRAFCFCLLCHKFQNTSKPCSPTDRYL